MSDFGLAMLFDRGGGQITPRMRDIIEHQKCQDPHAQALIAQVRQRWDELDAKEEHQKVMKTRTAGFKRCDYFVVTYCSFPAIFVFNGRTDRGTDILMSF